MGVLDVMAQLFLCDVLIFLAHLLGVILTSIKNEKLLLSLGL
jgi:hypothetical protein